MRTMWPYNAPGMPLPGRDFIAAASALGDECLLKGTGKKAVFTHSGQKLQELYERALYSRGEFKINITVKGDKKRLMPFIGGHRWGRATPRGPEPSNVMVIGKMLGEEEMNRERHFIGPTGQELKATLESMGIKHGAWYITNLLKCEDPSGGRAWSAYWEKEFLPLLYQELRIVRPKYILCLGSDASKALFNDKSMTVTAMQGRVAELKFPINKNPCDPDELEYHTSLVMTSLHPAVLFRAPEQRPEFESSVRRFGQLVKGIRWDQSETGIDHRVIDNLDDLKALAQEVIGCRESYVEVKGFKRAALIAVDAEWQGDHPQNAGSYVRTVQISWAHKKAACIKLRHAGGAVAFQGGIENAVKYLKQILKSTPQRPVRVCGHFFVSDMEWLIPLGLDLRDEFAVPEVWHRCIGEGGFDTGLAFHSIEETGDFGLKSLLLRYTSIPRYDLPIMEWLKKNGKKQKIIAIDESEEWSNQTDVGADLEGFGECPDEILIPYGNYDADGTRRLTVVAMKLLSRDPHGNNCWEPFWVNMRCTPAVLEMHMNGLAVDPERIDRLTETYMTSSSLLQQKLRDWARWPEFNIRSAFHVREFLFGEELNRKQRKNPSDPPIRIRPEKARSLYLTPITSTGKRPQPWSEIVNSGTEEDNTPGTNKMVLAILAEESQSIPKTRHMVTGKRIFTEGKPEMVDRSTEIRMIRDQRFVDQVLKSILRPPIRYKRGREFLNRYVERDGHWVYPGGLPAAVCDDLRVRTHIYQTKETGRWSSARPPLQNMPKRREDDHKRILGPAYKYSLRSIIKATPGRVLVEADFIGAELYGMAMMSGDEVMIDHCVRNQLPEDHPDYYDIHSNIAVFAFKLDIEPTKKALQFIGRAGLRIVAKSVIFGIAYGRGAKAIALAAKEEGVKITVEEAQQVIDAVFEMYTGLKPFFEACRRQALEVGWLCGPFGRFRRFARIPEYERLLDFRRRELEGELRPGEREPRMSSATRQTLGDIERQSMNFPIQGMIADGMSRAIDYLYNYRFQFDRDQLWYDLMLQIHDAVIVECDPQHVPGTIDALRHCLGELVPIYPCTLDGMWNNTGPYYLGVDVEICGNWGEVMLPDELRAMGIDEEKYGHWHPVDGFEIFDGSTRSGLVHDKFPRKIWTAEDGFLKAKEKPKAA